MKSKRQKKSDERAQVICRELLWQATNGGYADLGDGKLYEKIMAWSRVTKLIKYDRPE